PKEFTVILRPRGNVRTNWPEFSRIPSPHQLNRLRAVRHAVRRRHSICAREEPVQGNDQLVFRISADDCLAAGADNDRRPRVVLRNEYFVVRPCAGVDNVAIWTRKNFIVVARSYNILPSVGSPEVVCSRSGALDDTRNEIL